MAERVFTELDAEIGDGPALLSSGVAINVVVSTASAVSVEQNSLANFSRSVFLPNIGRQFPVRCTLPNTDLPLTLP